MTDFYDYKIFIGDREIKNILYIEKIDTVLSILLRIEFINEFDKYEVIVRPIEDFIFKRK